VTELLVMGDHPYPILNNSSGTFSVDLETTGLTWLDKILGVSLAWKEGDEYKSCYLFDTSGNAQLPMWGLGGVVSSDDLARAIESASRNVVFANHSFDYRFMMKGYGLRPIPNVVDVQLVARHIAPQPNGISLEALSSRYLGPLGAQYMEMKSKRASLAKMAPDMVAQYARDDALNTLKLWQVFLDLPSFSLYKKNHYWDQKFMYLIMKMVYRGLPLDMEYIEGRITEYRRTMIDIGSRLVRQGISNPNYAKDVMGFAKSKGIPLVNTQADTLEELDLDKYPELREVIAYRQYSKALGSWLEPLRDMGQFDGSFHSQLNPYGTRSFRMSSSDINAQGIPMETRGGRAFGSMFGVFKSHNLHEEVWGLDIKQAELRLAATLSRDADMISAVEATDPYIGLSNLIWGTPDNRNLAKRSLLSAIYEIGKAKFALTAGISEEAALDILKTVRGRFPQAMQTAKSMARVTKTTGRVDLVTGRPRWLQSDEAGHEYKAFNQYVQGGLAEIMRETMLRVEAAIPEKMLLQVHDSMVLLLSANKKIRDEQIFTVQVCMNETITDLLGEKYQPCPFPVEPKPYQVTEHASK